VARFDPRSLNEVNASCKEGHILSIITLWAALTSWNDKMNVLTAICVPSAVRLSRGPRHTQHTCVKRLLLFLGKEPSSAAPRLHWSQPVVSRYTQHPMSSWECAAALPHPKPACQCLWDLIVPTKAVRRCCLHPCHEALLAVQQHTNLSMTRLSAVSQRPSGHDSPAALRRPLHLHACTAIAATPTDPFCPFKLCALQVCCCCGGGSQEHACAVQYCWQCKPPDPQSPC
jgi:hypothetical protein